MSTLAVTASFLAIFVAVIVLILGKFIDVLAAPPTFKFLFKLSSAVKDLEAAREGLRAAKEDTDKKIADAERQFRTTTSQVEGWKKDVDNIMLDIDEVVKKYNRCGDKHFFSYICSIYSLATECAEYHQRVKDLRIEGSSITVAVESDFNDMFATTYEVPGSLELKYKKALEFVQHGNSFVNVIGVWGMGGVGKTTLLKKIYHSCVGSPYFQHVIYITASTEQSNVTKLQGEIVKKLRLNKDDDPDRLINGYLKNKNFILFIDDLWEAVDLTKVGVPNISSTDGYTRKVVFTTREKHVCTNMDAKEIIDVKCLDHTQSLILFKEKVGERVIQSHHLISELAEDVAKECKGLPLALITVGRAMSAKSNPDEWKFALDLMRKSQVQEVSGIKKNEIQRILKTSYDFLTEKALRECFLSISIWPEDSIMYQSEIIKCWMGLGIIENSGNMDAAYQLGVSYIGSLKAACLLEDVQDNDNLLRIPTVKMHDVLRDLATWIASDCGENKNKWISKARTRWPNLKLKWSEAECISLMFEGITELPSGITDCPNLHTLVLRGNKLTCEPISNSFENFHFLKYLDLSENELNDFPESVFALTELQYLDLSSNCIETIPVELRNLKKLKYLLLRENPIKCIPKGVFSELVDLLILDLFCVSKNNYGLDEEALTYLQEKLLTLGMTVRSEEELNKLMLLFDLNILELCIKDLKSRSFQFMSIMPSPYINKIPKCLRFLSITHSHDSLLEIVFDTDMTHTYLPSLNLRYLAFFDISVKRMIWRDTDKAPKKLFANLTVVDFTKCSVLEHVTWVIHLPCLQRLVIQECDNMRIAINGNQEASRALIFTSLKVLIIRKMPNLMMFSKHSLSFPRLLTLVVEDCLSLSPYEFNTTACPKIQIIWAERRIFGWNKLEWNDSYSKSVYSRLFQGRRKRHLKFERTMEELLHLTKYSHIIIMLVTCKSLMLCILKKLTFIQLLRRSKKWLFLFQTIIVKLKSCNCYSLDVITVIQLLLF